MKKVSKIISSIILGLVLVVTTGCSLKKEVIDNNKFASIMNDHKFNVTDVSDQYSSYDFVSSVQVAMAENKEFQIEFYVLNDVENTMKMYESNKSDFEKETSSSALTTDVSVNNYSSFSVTDKNVYRYLCRVENTLMYVDTTKEHKDEVEKIIATLGY